MSLTPMLGLVVQALPVALTWEKDLEYFEGPLMSLYRSPQGEPYVETWVDADDGVSRWLLFRVTPLDLLRYLFRKLTLRSLILDARDGFVFVRDRRSEGVESVMYVRVGHLPRAVLPGEESFHIPTGEELDVGEQPILLGDAHYEPEDLAHLRRVYGQVYSFRWAMGQGTELAYPLNGTFQSYRFSSGYVYGKALDSIERRLPIADRPTMLELRVASPGFMRLRVNPTLAELTRRAIAHFGENAPEISFAYGRLNEHVKEHKRVAKEHGPQWPGLETIAAAMPLPIESLLATFGYLDAHKLWNAGSNAVNTAALLTTYCRRVAELYEASSSGKAEVL